MCKKRQFFIASNWEFFGGYWGKRRIFWIGNGAEYRSLVIGRKGPLRCHCVPFGPFRFHLGNKQMPVRYLSTSTLYVDRSILTIIQRLTSLC